MELEAASKKIILDSVRYEMPLVEYNQGVGNLWKVDAAYQNPQFCHRTRQE
jgi:hypothetical protein